MKLLLLALLCVTPAVGQGIIIGHSEDSTYIPSIVQLYDQYKADCYADSTKVDRCAGMGDKLFGSPCEECTDSTYTYCGGGGGLTLELVIHVVPRYYWAHRGTSFDGFIEWLRKH